MTITPSDVSPASYETRFTRLVGCGLPIQSAPMVGVVRDAELPAAVAAAGGHGMFPAAFLQAPYLERVIDDLTDATRAYGVNFVGVFLDRECLELAADKAPLVDVFIAEPDAGRSSDTIHAGGALRVLAGRQRRAGTRAGGGRGDLVVVQGVEAGGHPAGELGLLPLLDEVLDAVAVPVVAAGGIGSARGVAAVLAAGRCRRPRRDTLHRGDGERRPPPATRRRSSRRERATPYSRARSRRDPVETTQRVLVSAPARRRGVSAGEPAGEVVLGGARCRCHASVRSRRRRVRRARSRRWRCMPASRSGRHGRRPGGRASSPSWPPVGATALAAGQPWVDSGRTVGEGSHGRRSASARPGAG